MKLNIPRNRLINLLIEDGYKAVIHYNDNGAREETPLNNDAFDYFKRIGGIKTIKKISAADEAHCPNCFCAHEGFPSEGHTETCKECKMPFTVYTEMTVRYRTEGTYE